jgi:hypothetical protein
VQPPHNRLLRVFQVGFNVVTTIASACRGRLRS